MGDSKSKKRKNTLIHPLLFKYIIIIIIIIIKRQTSTNDGSSLNVKNRDKKKGIDYSISTSYYSVPQPASARSSAH